MITVIRKEPGKPPETVTIPNTLKAMQEAVGGYIETVTVASDAVVICNEEGGIFDLPYNCRICNIDFLGTVLITGVKGEEFADVPYPELWIKHIKEAVGGNDGNIGFFRAIRRTAPV